MSLTLTQARKSRATQTEARVQRAAHRRATGTAARGPGAPQRLQRTIGNEGTQALLQRMAKDLSAPAIQAKLEVGAVDDPLEREADIMADRVMRMNDGACCAGCANGGSCDGGSTTVHRARTAPGGAVDLPPDTEDQVRRLTGGGAPLPETVRTQFEPRFGADLSGVRVHRDAAAADSSAALGAKAWTLGNHIAFGAGQWAPGTNEGNRLIAHELAHTVQQNDTVAAVFRQTATSPGMGGGPDPCLSLLEAIIELLNEVAKRFNDALNDEHDLYKFHREKHQSHPDHGSWEGHRERYDKDRGRLRQKLADWGSNDDCRGYLLGKEQEVDLKEAEEFGNKEFPKEPAPTHRPVKPPVPATREAQEEAADAEPSFRERVAEALRKAGIPAWAVAGMVVLVIAALADPEPITKLALLLGTAAAVVVLVAIGRSSDVPPGGATTA